MSSAYVGEYVNAEEELKAYGAENPREELQLTMRALQEEAQEEGWEAPGRELALKESVYRVKHEVDEEREWHEREGEHIPAWMDEEKITAREYEGLDQVDDYTRTRYAETPEDIDERIRSYQENYGETAEERVEAYQEEAREEERETGYRIKAW